MRSKHLRSPRARAAGFAQATATHGKQTRFWDLHAELDVDHGAWAFEALAAVTHDVEAIKAAARLGAEAWWRFLDEREAAAPVSAGAAEAS